MLTTLEPQARAQVQLHALLGALPELVRLSPQAASIVAADPKPTSIGFAVRGGPHGVLAFADGGVEYRPDQTSATIRLPFATPEAFSKVIDGQAQPIPVTGLHRIGFLLKVFAPLSEELERVLRPTPAALQDPEFAKASTILTLYVACAAVAQLANHDTSGRYSAHNTPDGDIAVEVGDELAYTLRVADHTMTFIPEPSPRPRAAMHFADFDIAAKVLSGEASAMACICAGTLSMRGMLNMVDNLNRILDRAGQYLGA
jgi:hypothetical protein